VGSRIVVSAIINRKIPLLLLLLFLLTISQNQLVSNATIFVVKSETVLKFPECLLGTSICHNTAVLLSVVIELKYRSNTNPKMCLCGIDYVLLELFSS
jgi:hypothetical protein